MKIWWRSCKSYRFSNTITVTGQKQHTVSHFNQYEFTFWWCKWKWHNFDLWKSIYWKETIRYKLAKIGKKRLVDSMQWAMTLYIGSTSTCYLKRTPSTIYCPFTMSKVLQSEGLQSYPYSQLVQQLIKKVKQYVEPILVDSHRYRHLR